MEGAGVLIPPQVQWYVDYRIFNVVTGATIAATDAGTIGCQLSKEPAAAAQDYFLLSLSAATAASIINFY